MNQDLRVNKTTFHIKGFALGLTLKQRRKVTRKSPIGFLHWDGPAVGATIWPFTYSKGNYLETRLAYLGDIYKFMFLIQRKPNNNSIPDNNCGENERYGKSSYYRYFLFVLKFVIRDIHLENLAEKFRTVHKISSLAIANKTATRKLDELFQRSKLSL